MTGESPLRALREARLVKVGEHSAEIVYDPDAEVWFVRAASLPGVVGEAGSLEELEAELPGLIQRATMP